MGAESSKLKGKGGGHGVKRIGKKMIFEVDSDRAYAN